MREVFVFLLRLVVFANVALTSPYGPYGDNATRVQGIEDVIAGWNPDQHLFVKGELGLSEQQLSELEKWLDENGKHWTILLMDEAEDESYQSEDGRNFFGMDAVEFALAQGLANRTGFGMLINELTGEADGAVFVIFLKERKFSYYGSDVHDRRGLGESQWIGDLDRESIRAMRNGGRIVDAVKNTVTTIEKRLTKKLQSEMDSGKFAKAEAELATVERRRDLESLKSTLEEIQSSSLMRIEESASQVRSAFPGAAGAKLANPPLKEWKSKSDEILADISRIESDENTYQSITIREISQRTNQLRGELERYLDWYAAHKSFQEMVAPIEERLSGIATAPSVAANAARNEAMRVLETARVEHGRGDTSFVENVKLASELANRAKRAIELEELRTTKKQERKSVVRWTLTIVGSIFSAVLLGVLWLLNRRRRPAMQRAQQLFDRSRDDVDEVTGTVDELSKHAERVLGWMGTFRQRGFVGQTQESGDRIISNLKSLDGMLTEAKLVIASAEQLIDPTSPATQVLNMLSISNYERCTSLLTGESVSVPAVTSEEMHAGVASRNSLTPFLESMRRLATETSQMVDSFEYDVLNVGSRLNELLSRLNDAMKLEHELSVESDRDEKFPVPAFLAQLLPSVKTNFETASSLAEKDPVRVMTDLIPLGNRMLTEGMSIGNSIQRARQEVIPGLEVASTQLRTHGFDVRWIDEQIFELGEMGEHLFVKAAESSVADLLSRFDGEIEDLEFRARRCGELANEIQEKTEPELDKLRGEIAEARRMLAARLNIEETQVLHEINYDPDEELQQARNQLESARAALNYGGVESAIESLEVLAIESSAARHLVDSTVLAVDEFDTHFDQRQSRHAILAERLPEIQNLIDRTQPKYAASALNLREVDASKTVIGLKVEADQILLAVADTCRQAKSLHTEGRILQSANLLQLVDEEMNLVEQLVRDISDHCGLLDRQSEQNMTDIASRLDAISEIEDDVRDGRTQTDTLRKFEVLRTAIHDLAKDMRTVSSGRDPFQDQQSLSEVMNGFETLKAMLDADRNEFAEASLAVQGVAEVLAAAQQSVTRSLNDQIADSSIIKRCQNEVYDLEARYGSINERLQRPHEDWRDVDREAGQVTSQLVLVDGELRRELELAQDAVRELQAASSAVFEAASWRGSYGVRVVGKPGSEELAQARRFLAEGEYSDAMRSSRSAAFRARSGLDFAKREVVSRQQQAAQAEAAARRRRQRRTISVGTGVLGAGKSTSRRSSSRTSKRASGSGFRRSGW